MLNISKDYQKEKIPYVRLAAKIQISNKSFWQPRTGLAFYYILESTHCVGAPWVLTHIYVGTGMTPPQIFCRLTYEHNTIYIQYE